MKKIEDMTEEERRVVGEVILKAFEPVCEQLGDIRKAVELVAEEYNKQLLLLEKEPEPLEGKIGQIGDLCITKGEHIPLFRKVDVAGAVSYADKKMEEDVCNNVKVYFGGRQELGIPHRAPTGEEKKMYKAGYLHAMRVARFFLREAFPDVVEED